MKRKPNLIGKAFHNYLTASVMTVAATQVANIVDASIVGNLIGPEGLAAVNLSKPLLQAFFAMSCLYISSSTMLVGIAIGKKDKATAQKLFTFAIVASLALGAVFTTLGLASFNPLSQLLCNSDSLRPMTNSFMLITILSATPQLLMYAFNQFVTVDGSPRLVTRAVIISNIFNIAFDIIFIKYCGWGIAGAAWATFMMYIADILLVLPHFRKKGTLRLSMIKRGDVGYGQIFSYGLPLFFGTVLLSVQFICNNHVAGKYLGDGGLVALAVCMQLFSFSMIILTGTLRTIQPVGSILKGMDDNRGMRFLIQKAYVFLSVCLAIYTVAIVAFPTQIAMLLGASNEQTLPVILEALPPFTLNIIMQALLYNLMPIYQFYGHKRLALFLSIGQTLLPMFGFWALKGGWLGFFLGQAVVAAVIYVGTRVVRSRTCTELGRSNKALMPIFLIPATHTGEVYELTMETTFEALHESMDHLKGFLVAHGQEKEKALRYILCAEELIKNIIVHGHARYVDVRATSSIISIHDDGKPFNPIVYKDEGEGIGLKMVHGIGLDIKYDYRFNQNMLTIAIQP